MTAPTALDALADRCEAATGADRELDALIANLIGWRPHWATSPIDSGVKYGKAAPTYTASLDAAMTLSDGFFKLQADSVKGWAALGKMGRWCHAATPALALCAAALRARARTQETTDVQ